MLDPLFIKRKKNAGTKGSLTPGDISHLYSQLDINNRTLHFLVLGCFELRKAKNHKKKKERKSQHRKCCFLKINKG